MIERYSRKEMVQIWSPEEKFNIWFQIEAHACDAQADLGVIPKEAAKVIWKKPSEQILPQRKKRKGHSALWENDKNLA